MFTLNLNRNDGGPPDGAAAGHADPAIPFDELRPLFDRELRRARRYGRALSVVVVGDVASADPLRRLAHLGSMLQDVLRETDLVAHRTDRGDLAVLLPETDAAAAAQSCLRIRRQLAAMDAGDVRVGTATYPADGVTLDALLGHAHPFPRDEVTDELDAPGVGVHA